MLDKRRVVCHHQFMQILEPTPVSTSRFTMTEGFVLVAEMSDLPPLGRVYDDACDVGLTLVSHKTGRKVVMAIHSEKRDAEGELQYIELRPARSSDYSLVTVRLFND